MSDESRTIVIGPGKDRWPGSPTNRVENNSQSPSPTLTQDGDNGEREANQKRILRLKVISALQRSIAMAALRFTEAEIQEQFAEAMSNVRNHNGSDYS